ncbi:MULTISPECIES: hypothetical protein [Halorhodospira]|uniref:hypothetical protein n=1 Tax=Halorhodospira TaxID=85108 RepID=UPI001913B1F8|nr:MULTISPECIES: hypothetical protein [Halorhodospira]MBK5936500.1 hypothetical protein [Halorhodospira halophila]MCG5537296.1 hypothetical protein [Halorhodospira sp. 9622]MCG5540140.1 hypothetical protein [Halorhodospira sp. M39old]MCG5545159.1 hypothetical protein [Halorhodospira sp. M38]
MAETAARRGAVPTWLMVVAYLSAVFLPTLGLLLGMYLGYRRVLLHAFVVVGISTIVGFFWYPMVFG